MTTYDMSQQQTDLGINLGGFEENSGFEPFPAGDYVMQAIKIELAQSQAGNTMVKVEFRVLGGQFEDRAIFENFNIQHANPKVVEIAIGKIKQWVMACGGSGNEQLTLELLQALEGCEFMAKVGIQKDKSGMYGDQNRINSYKPHQHATKTLQGPVGQPAGDQQQQPQAAAQTQQQPAQGAASQNPWEKQ